MLNWFGVLEGEKDGSTHRGDIKRRLDNSGLLFYWLTIEVDENGNAFLYSWTVPTLAANGGVIQKSFVVTATQTITNSNYGVRADGGDQAKGLTSVTTSVENKEEDKARTYLPLITKN